MFDRFWEAVSITLMTVCLSLIATQSLAGLAGDINADGKVDAGDVYLIKSFALGTDTPTPQESVAADAAPLGNPDGQINAGDVTVLEQVALGQIVLGPSAPILNAGMSPTNSNPYSITGTATPGIEVTLFVEGEPQAATDADEAGNFAFSAVLQDGNNDIYAVAYDGQNDSLPSNTLVVDYQNILSRSLGSLTINEDTVWTPGSTPTPYIISGTLTIANGAKLRLQPGVELKFVNNGNSKMVVEGSLLVQGTAGSKVLFTSTAQNSNYDWEGIEIKAGSGEVTIDHAVIEYANRGIYFNASGNRGAVTNSVIQNNQTGVRVYRSASPTLTQNQVINNSTGFEIYGNGAFNNNPSPVIRDNAIHDNSTNYLASSFFDGRNQILDASNNWWGTADIYFVELSISHANDTSSSSTPYVYYAPHQIDENGTLYTGQALIGYVSDALTPLTANTIYDVPANLTVKDGDTLTIPEGVMLRFVNNGVVRLYVNGTLHVQGTEGNEVIFTSRARYFIYDWGGLWINNGSGEVNIQHALIEYARTGITFENSDVRGIISKTLIQNNQVGIEVIRNASPTLTHNRIVNNGGGFSLRGNNQPSNNPAPIINENTIYGSSADNISISSFYNGASTTLDFSNNWWNTTNLTEIGNKIFDRLDHPILPLVDLGVVATGPTTPPVLINSVNSVYISPNGDLVLDTSDLTGVFDEPATWEIKIRNSSGLVVKTAVSTLTDTALAFNWDGSGDSVSVLPDDRYFIHVIGTAGARTGMVGLDVIIIDNTPPESLFNNETTGATYFQSVSTPLSGSATDINFKNYTVEYRAAGSSDPWAIIGSTTHSAKVNNGVLEDWLLGDSSATVVPLPNGDYELRLTTEDVAGNMSEQITTVTLDLIPILNVVATGDADDHEINLAENDTLDVEFDLLEPGTVTLKIYELVVDGDYYVQGLLIKTISQSYLNSGQHSLQWDGTDETGDPMLGVYEYVLETSNGTTSDVYAVYDHHQAPPTTTFITGNASTAFNPFANEHWYADVSFAEPGRVQLGIRLDASSFRWIYPDGPGRVVDAGTTRLYWDGVDTDTDLFYMGPIGAQYTFTPFSANTVVVKNSGQDLAIRGQAPTVEVKADPYLVYLSYGHFTKILYHLDTPGNQDAAVVIKLLPPGVTNINDPQVIEIHNATEGPGNHEVEWTGVDVGDPNATTRTISADGAYTFAIEATVGGSTTLYRGVLNAYQ